MNDEWFSFEIWDASGSLIALISPTIELTKDQMTDLMEIFDGHDNSESWYKITECD